MAVFVSIWADVMLPVCDELIIEGIDMVDVRLTRFDGLFTDAACVVFPGLVFAVAQALVFWCAITLHFIPEVALAVAQISHDRSLGYGPCFWVEVGPIIIIS